MTFTLRTDPELDQALSTLAESSRLSKQEVVRAAVLEKLERETRRSEFNAHMEANVARWSDVLDRLSR